MSFLQSPSSPLQPSDAFNQKPLYNQMPLGRPIPPAGWPMSVAPHFANGGRVMAHFNKSELDDIEQLLGHSKRDHHSGLRDLEGLEHVLEHPGIIDHLSHAVRESRTHRAMGGVLNQMADAGRNGDNEMALLSPQAANTLNTISGYPSMNPTTGKPEYFSFGNAFSGIAKTLGRGASGLARGASGLGGVLSKGASSLGKAASGFASRNPNFIGGLKTLGSKAAETGLQTGLGALTNWSQGQNVGDAFKNAGNDAVNNTLTGMANTEGNPSWMRNLGQAGQMGKTMLENRLNRPADAPEESLQDSLRSGIQKHLPTVMNRGIDMMESRGMMPDWAREGAHGARDFVNEGLQSGDWAGAGRNAAQRGMNYGADRLQSSAPEWARAGIGGARDFMNEGMDSGDWAGAGRRGATRAFDQGMDRVQQHAPQEYGDMLRGFQSAGRAGISGQGDWRDGMSDAFRGGAQVAQNHAPEWARQPMQDFGDAAQDTFDTGIRGGNWQNAARQGIGRGASRYAMRLGRPTPSYDNSENYGYGYGG